MTNPYLEAIKIFIIRKLNERYGYCGVADGDDIAIINSSGDGEDFQITIKSTKETTPCQTQ